MKRGGAAVHHISKCARRSDLLFQGAFDAYTVVTIATRVNISNLG